MSLTSSTFPLLLLAAFLAFKAKGQFIPVVMFLSVFEAASLVNIGGGTSAFPVQAAYVAMAFAIVKGFAAKPQRVTTRQSRLSTLLLSAFVLYACVSVFLGPIIFHGTLIFNPRLPYNPAPLAWNFSFLNQLAYLLLFFCFYLVAVYRTSEDELMKAINWFVAGAACAACIAIIQLLCLKSGLAFPSWLFHTGTYQNYEAYDLADGISRVNGTFPEASAAAFAFTVALALVVWKILSGPLSLKNCLYAITILTALILTSSSTGYLCLAYVATGALIFLLARAKGNSTHRKNKLLIACAMGFIIFSLAATSVTRELIYKSLQTVLFEKVDSESYRHRSEINQIAVDACWATAGLGTGWGTSWASSFLATTLGNVGIPGLLTFLLFLFTVFAPVTRLATRQSRIHGGVLFALGAALIDLAIALPDLVHCSLWLLLAVAVRIAARKPRPLYIQPALAANLLNPAHAMFLQNLRPQDGTETQGSKLTELRR